MGEFQRSPSKVWWYEESLSWLSGSSGSQDSGFSDTETSPQQQQQQQQQQKQEQSKEEPELKTPEKSPVVDLQKNTSGNQLTNFTTNIVEKTTPEKCLQFSSPQSCYYVPSTTPVRKIIIDGQAKTEPCQRTKKTLSDRVKVSRNLFRSMQEHTNEQSIEDSKHARGNDEVFEDSEEVLDVTSCKTLPLCGPRSPNYPPNISAPALLGFDASTSFHRGESDAESEEEEEEEIEAYFQQKAMLESPNKTSTPKTLRNAKGLKLGRLHALNLLKKYEKVAIESENPAVCKWLEGIKISMENEAMVTLQSKSIAAELSEKVANLAAQAASTLRKILKEDYEIVMQFDIHQNSQKDLSNYFIEDLLKKIESYCTTYNIKPPESLRLGKPTSQQIQQLQKQYQMLHTKNLRTHISQLTETLEDPASELQIRAQITALTSLCLRHESLVSFFVENGAIQTIVTLIEKCEGSSVRSMCLRALTTLCLNAEAIRKLEGAAGLTATAEIITDISRPEPERFEAITLLAQITAPWIEDNHSISGLQRHSKKLVKYLTKYLETTKCCQNLLLCTAALANLTAMESKAIKYVLNNETISILLEIVKKHGNSVSIYILEQLATLLANMSSVAEARVALCNYCTPVALICFLQTTAGDSSVVMRLRQKSVIALSRLCTVPDAAKQIVDAGGVLKLVQLCRQKKKRYDNDAILVASLATLRKIAEVCGVGMLAEEDVQELIQPKLMDSFKAYSTQHESLV